eukprot:gene4710-3402_t
MCTKSCGSLAFFFGKLLPNAKREKNRQYSYKKVPAYVPLPCSGDLSVPSPSPIIISNAAMGQERAAKRWSCLVEGNRMPTTVFVGAPSFVFVVGLLLLWGDNIYYCSSQSTLSYSVLELFFISFGSLGISSGNFNSFRVFSDLSAFHFILQCFTYFICMFFSVRLEETFILRQFFWFFLRLEPTILKMIKTQLKNHSKNLTFFSWTTATIIYELWSC